MRVTSEFWASAIVRRAFASGGFAAVVRRGAAEAGAIAITLRSRDGEMRLLLPAPQSEFDAASSGERRFTELMRTFDHDAIQARLDREVRFDPDLWVVELDVEEATLAELVPTTTP